MRIFYYSSRTNLPAMGLANRSPLRWSHIPYRTIWWKVCRHHRTRPYRPLPHTLAGDVWLWCSPTWSPLLRPRWYLCPNKYLQMSLNRFFYLNDTFYPLLSRHLPDWDPFYLMVYWMVYNNYCLVVIWLPGYWFNRVANRNKKKGSLKMGFWKGDFIFSLPQ